MDDEYYGCVIVPGCNEAQRIAPLLQVLGRAAVDLRLLVVVSCNGCTDATSSIAARFGSIHVLDSPTPGKCHAINTAESFFGDVFPRLYVDADVRIEQSALAALMAALRSDEPVAAYPEMVWDLAGTSWPVRCYYRQREYEYRRPGSAFSASLTG